MIPLSLSKVLKLMIVLTRHFLGISALLFPRLIVFIEIARVGRVSQFRYDGPLDLAVVEGIPVHRGEKGVGFDTVDAAGEAAEALSRVDSAEAGDEGAGVRVKVGGEFDFADADPAAWEEMSAVA